MSQRAKCQQKIPKHLNEYVLGTKEHSKHDMECSDEGHENITFIPPKPKIAKLNKDPNELLKDTKIELNYHRHNLNQMITIQKGSLLSENRLFIVFGFLAQ